MKRMAHRETARRGLFLETMHNTPLSHHCLRFCYLAPQDNGRVSLRCPRNNDAAIHPCTSFATNEQCSDLRQVLGMEVPLS